MATLQSATNPHSNANVFASAGSGKTWLLITRICRLLLAGAAPQHILAITFTRKSAADMRMRLHERLSQWAVMPDRDLQSELIDIGETPSANTITRARNLYEELLFSEPNIRICTFHSFCEEVVRAFPLESELPAMFEITEHTHIYINQAFKLLLQQSEQSSETELRNALQMLYEFCFGFNNTKKALLSFLTARNEWRAYTETAHSPCTQAIKNLEIALERNNKHESPISTKHPEFIECMQHYHSALLLSETKTRLEAAASIDTFLRTHKNTNNLLINLIKPVFLTSKLEIRKLNPGEEMARQTRREKIRTTNS